MRRAGAESKTPGQRPLQSGDETRLPARDEGPSKDPAMKRVTARASLLITAGVFALGLSGSIRSGLADERLRQDSLQTARRTGRELIQRGRYTAALDQLRAAARQHPTDGEIEC